MNQNSSVYVLQSVQNLRFTAFQNLSVQNFRLFSLYYWINGNIRK